MINIKKAEQLTGCPGRTLRYWCSRGYLEAQKVGRAWIITLSENKLKKAVVKLCR